MIMNGENESALNYIKASKKCLSQYIPVKPAEKLALDDFTNKVSIKLNKGKKLDDVKEEESTSEADSSGQVEPNNNALSTKDAFDAFLFNNANNRQ